MRTALSKRSHSVLPGTDGLGSGFICTHHTAVSCKLSLHGNLSGKFVSPKDFCAIRAASRMFRIGEEVSPLANLRIPDRFKAGFVVLASLPTPSYEEFLAATKAAPNTFASTRELQTWIASEVKSIPQADIAKLIETMSSVLRLQSRSPETMPKLVAALDEAAHIGIENFNVADGVDFSARLTALLTVESFNIVAIKAKELQLECERTFCDARILTDIRPVFGEKAGDKPAAMIVVHTLKIITHKAAGHKEFFVALDAEDIQSLKKTLERAEEKARSLKTIIDASGLRSIDLS